MADRRANIRSIFDASERIFLAKLEAIRASVHHAGLKGSAVEELVREFFEGVLPKNIGVGTGIIIDQHGNASRQVDIVLYDAATTPKFLSYGSVNLYPVECVYFVIEVKTSLGANDFDQCISNMESIKSLDSSAYLHDNGPIYSTKILFGKEFKTWAPIFLVFALEASNFEAIARRFAEHRGAGIQVEKQIDSIFVLGGGTIANIGKDLLVSLLPTPDCRLIIPEDRGIFVFLTLFSVYFNQASIGAKFDFLKYVGLNIGRSRILVEREDLESWQPGHPVIDLDVDRQA